MMRFVGLGEFSVTNDPGDLIKTFALASCVGITAFSSIRGVAGMTHIVLPECPDIPDKDKPCYYADKGVPLFIDKMLAAGCKPGELRIKIFGGANNMIENDIFNIGARNLEAVERVLGEMNICYELSDVGGNISRTLEMNAGTGDVIVKSLLLNYAVSI